MGKCTHNSKSWNISIEIEIEMGNNLDKWVTESHIVLAVHYIYSTLLCAIPLNIRLLSESEVFTINTKSYALYYTVFPFQTLRNSVYKRLYLWRAININIQSHLIVLAGPFEFLQLLLFEFRFYILFVHFSFDISHDNTAIQRTHRHIFICVHTTKETTAEKDKRKRRHHHSIAVGVFVVAAAASYHSISFVCRRALLFSCHLTLSWHIRYQVQCVYAYKRNAEQR